MTYATASDIVKNVAVEVGLTEPVDDIFASTDSAIQQMIRLLNVCIRHLAEEKEWPNFTRTHTDTATGAENGLFELPSNFDRMVPQTMWGATLQNPIVGSVSSQTWQSLQNGDFPLTWMVFREWMGMVQYFPSPEADDAFTYEYQCNEWVAEAGNNFGESGTPTTLKSAVTAYTDVVLFNQTLIEQKLKVKWLEAKGFDSRTARGELADVVESRGGVEPTAQVLNAGRSGRGLRYLDYVNVPETGYGSS